MITGEMFEEMLESMHDQTLFDEKGSVSATLFGVEEKTVTTMIELLYLQRKLGASHEQCLQLAFVIGAVCGRKDAVDSLE